MSEKMKALVYQGKDTLEVEYREIPQLEPGEALIGVKYAGICGTDLGILAGKHPRATPPLIMGHEFSGEIVRLNNVSGSGFKVGDRVTAEPLISCGNCFACRMGFRHVCQNLKLYGIDEDGAFAQYMRVPINKLYRIPRDIPFNIGALVEPLAVAVHAVRLSGVGIGDVVCVLGGGTVGLLTALVARMSGTDNVIVFEKQPHRIHIAHEYGLKAMDVNKNDPLQEINRQTNNRGADVVFEAAGSPESVLIAPGLCRVRGKVIVIAIPKEPRPMDMVALTFKEITVKGIRVYEPFDFERAINILSKKTIDLSRLIFGTFPLDKAQKAFQTAKEGKKAMRVLFKID